MKHFHLTIVRHGETVGNTAKLIQGQSDTPLTDLGVAQATALGKHFAHKIEFNKIYTSDLARAKRTCAIIIESGCAIDRPTILLDERLRERSYGRYEGKTISELKQDAYGLGYDDHNFTEFPPDGGESMDEVQRRVKLFCHDVLWSQAEVGDEVLLVSHWGIIKEFFKLFQPHSNGSILDEHIRETPNVSYSRFEIRFRGENVRSWPVLVEDTRSRFGLEIVGLVLHGTSHLKNTQVTVNLEEKLK